MNSIKQNTTTTIRRLALITTLAVGMLAALPRLTANAGQAFAQTTSTREPVLISSSEFIPSTFGFHRAKLYTVPAHKRLIIEFVSVRDTGVSKGGKLNASISFNPDTPAEKNYPIPLERVTFSTKDQFQTHRQVRFHANPGQDVFVYFMIDSNLSESVELALSGYLEDVP
jgi:hypothetical protein